MAIQNTTCYSQNRIRHHGEQPLNKLVQSAFCRCCKAFSKPLNRLRRQLVVGARLNHETVECVQQMLGIVTLVLESLTLRSTDLALDTVFVKPAKKII